MSFVFINIYYRFVMFNQNQLFMKKNLRTVLFLMLMSVTLQLSAQRFLSEVFTSTTVTSNVTYGRNWSTLYSPVSLFMDTLKADVYQPAGDTMVHRPTVFVLHPGSAFPAFYNYWCTGTKTDSAVAEMCRQFARRGYTAIALNYRLGWNPFSTDQDTRTGSLLEALGRGVQDIKACVRFFRNNALTSNTYHINPDMFILGGLSTGGTLALNYITLQNYSQIQIFKYLSANDNATYHFHSGTTYFDSTYWGNFDGYNGDPNLNYSGNTPGVSNAVQFGFSLEGVLGDSSWLHNGDVPMVCFHNIPDVSTPYYCGAVYSLGQFVVNVCGGHMVIHNADVFQNNFAFQNNNWTDIYTTTANQRNGGSGHDGLYPFSTASPQSAPWEWWDSTTAFQIMINQLGFTMGHADTVWYNSIADNPDMSSAKGHAYLDTVMRYLNPRIYRAVGLNVGIWETAQQAESVSLYPNPATDQFTVNASTRSTPIRYIHVYDLTGRLVRSFDKINKQQFMMNTRSFESGIYMLKIGFEKDEVVRKVTFQ